MLVLVLSIGSCHFVDESSRRQSSTVERQIKAVLELPTYEYVYRDIIYIADQAEFLGFRHRDKQLLFAVDVHLQAGIDLKKGVTVKPAKSQPGGNRGLSITLPAPQILMIDADETSITQYFKKEFGGEISRLEYYDEISRSKTKIRRDAVQRGVLIRARENAASVVRSLLQSQGIEPVVVQFRGSSEGSSP
ncbi:MAG: DUF4230 domain-containing protein [Spirochaetota bacterium]